MKRVKKDKSRFDALGDRMKKYEGMETGRTLMPGLPIMVRLDGRGFSKFTRGMARPFHEPMSRAMIETARHLVAETHASFAYTQSDEITLGFWNDDPKHEALFGGRVQKLVSVYAGMATSKFMEQTMLLMPDRVKRLPVLDARVFNMPNLEEMAECVLFRALDCAKNSITMAASAYYPHRELHGKSGGQKHEMLHAKGINWAEYPEFFKNGTFLRRETASSEVSAERLARIPEKHRHLHTGKASRSSVVEVDMPPFARVANPIGVLFYGAAPIRHSDMEIRAAA